MIRRALAVAVTLGVLGSASTLAIAEDGGARTAASTLEARLAPLRSTKGLEARFREEKVMALLAAPLVSEGTIHFMAPDHIARHTLTPRRSSVILEGSRMTVWDGKRTQRIDAASNPVAAAFIESFAAILRGDRGALERTWKVDVTADKGPSWELTLQPKDAALARNATVLRFRWDDVTLNSLLIEENNGDRTTITFRDVDAKKVWSPDEAARVFRVPE